MNYIKISISFEGKITPSDSLQLIQLAELFEKEGDLSVQIEKKDPEPGERDGGLVIGLTIAGLVIAAIGTFFDILSYWQSQQPTYSVSVTVEGVTFLVNNVPLGQVQYIISMLKELKEQKASQDIKILIARE